MPTRVEIGRTGHVRVVTSASVDTGASGLVIAERTAEALGVPLASVAIAYREGEPQGTNGLQTALDEASESLRTTAARMLRCEPDDVFLAENRAYSKLDFHAALDLEDVVRTTARTSGMQSPLVFEVA